MRRGIGIGGSTTPPIACPSSLRSDCRAMSEKNIENQCGGRSMPGRNASGSRSSMAAIRRTIGMAISSSVIRTRPIQGRRMVIASSMD